MAPVYDYTQWTQTVGAYHPEKQNWVTRCSATPPGHWEGRPKRRIDTFSRNQANDSNGANCNEATLTIVPFPSFSHNEIQWVCWLLWHFVLGPWITALVVIDEHWSSTDPWSWTWSLVRHLLVKVCQSALSWPQRAAEIRLVLCHEAPPKSPKFNSSLCSSLRSLQKLSRVWLYYAV